MTGPGNRSQSDYALPVVRIRLPIWLLIWPAIFSAGMVAFLTMVVVNTWQAGRGSVIGILFLVPFILVPTGILLSLARAHLVTVGPSIHLRTTLTTRVIPAVDIHGFVLVDQTGRRDGGLFRRPAISLVPGSPSDAEYRWTNRNSAARAARRGWLLMTNQWGGDIPLSCVHHAIFSTRRADQAISDLNRWHQAALRLSSALPPP